MELPALRDIAKTAPYFYDGSVGILEEIIRFCVEDGRASKRG